MSGRVVRARLRSPLRRPCASAIPSLPSKEKYRRRGDSQVVFAARNVHDARPVGIRIGASSPTRARRKVRTTGISRDASRAGNPGAIPNPFIRFLCSVSSVVQLNDCGLKPVPLRLGDHAPGAVSGCRPDPSRHRPGVWKPLYCPLRSPTMRMASEPLAGGLQTGRMNRRLESEGVGLFAAHDRLAATWCGNIGTVREPPRLPTGRTIQCGRLTSTPLPGGARSVRPIDRTTGRRARARTNTHFHSTILTFTFTRLGRTLQP